MKNKNKTKVVHLRKEFYDIRIDRQTKFGNPFRIGFDGDRAEVIDKYNRWLKGEAFHTFKQTQRKWILDHLNQLKGKTLGCWCDPMLCHGDILVKLIEE